MTRALGSWIGSAVAAAAAIISCNAALAHVTVQPADAPADSYAHLTFNVPHGCNGSANTALRIKLPEGILSAKPQMKTGWNVQIKSRKLETPAQGPHGNTITDVVDEVAWRGGPLPDSLYDTFGLVLRLPGQAGQNLYFSAVQECEEGVERWIEIPQAGQVPDGLHKPAPVVRLKAKR